MKTHLLSACNRYAGLLICGLFLLNACDSYQLSPLGRLRCEGLIEPGAIDNNHPHFSWTVCPESGILQQSAYQLLAASSPSLLNEKEADLWNSGKVSSSRSFYIPYEGKELQAKDLIYWKVRIWNEKEQPTSWSRTASFSIGYLSEDCWQAEFIGEPADQQPQSPQFRNRFDPPASFDKAMLHVNSLGYHEVYLNGKAIHPNVLTPAVAQFNKRSQIITYDVTDQLRKGTNDIVIWLGKGWYQNDLPGVVAGGPFVRAQLETLSEGEWTICLKTDNRWQVRESGYSSINNWRPHHLAGEAVDARQLLPDFDSSTLDKASWAKAVVAYIPAHRSTPQMVELNSLQEEYHPVSRTAINDSTWVYDMGTNFTGWTDIHFPTLREGQHIRISYCDFLDDKGQFRDGLFEDRYIASGKPDEHFVNKFNYQAYRYLLISPLREAIDRDKITGRLIHTDYQGSASFRCSDKDLNNIHDMLQHTLRCLSLGGYIVDCPHFERLGYGGDGNASLKTAQTLFYMPGLYANWMQAWSDCIREDGGMPHTAPNPYNAGGGPFWCGFLIHASWQSYVNYGDSRLLKKYYPDMNKWFTYVDRYTVNGLLKQWPNTDYRNWYLGDWATPTGIDQADPSSVDLVNNCFIATCCQTMSKIASVLGDADQAETYRQRYEALSDKIQSTFYHSGKQCYSTGTQIDNTYPILAGITPDSLKEDVTRYIRESTSNQYKGHLSTGLVGIAVVTDWAIANGEADFMYQMLKKRDYPGYLYMIDNGGTTTWEHWNGERSRIHNCYNGLGAWFYQALAGLQPDENAPGYSHFFIRPQIPEGLKWVEAEQPTSSGIIRIKWENTATSFILQATIPAGSKASVSPPFAAKAIRINGQPGDLQQLGQLPGGNYHFEFVR